MSTFGPRLIFKDDRDSSIGRGCVLYGWHFRPEMAAIPRAAAASAPLGCETIRFTEGYRDICDDRDDHEDFNAFDITVEIADEERLNRAHYLQMAQRMKIFLGPDYGYRVHGEGFGEHIHFRYRRQA